LMHDFGMDLFFNGVKDVLRLHVLLVREKFIRGFKGCYGIAVRSVAFDKRSMLIKRTGLGRITGTLAIRGLRYLSR
jgi:hypothetical protein